MIPNRVFSRMYVFTASAMAFLLCIPCFAGVQQDIAWLRGKCTDGQGAVAWRDGSANQAYMFDVATGSKITLGASSWIAPRFSPNGSKVAWIDGTTAKGRMRNESTMRVIATGVTADGGIHWITDDEVVVNIGGKWNRVKTDGTKQEVGALASLIGATAELDIKLQSNGVWSVSYVSGSLVYFKSSDGKSGTVPNVTCSASLSPDGKSAAGLGHGHDEATYKNFYTGATGTVGRTLADCSDKGFDNHRWSSSDSRFIVAQYECSNKIAIWEISTSDCFIAGDAGGESYGDFANGPVSGSWSGGTTPVTPKIICDVSTLSFSAIEGGAAPSAKTVKVYTAEGEMSGVTATESADWLSISAGGASGSEVTLTNGVTIAGKAAGDYTTTVTVSSSNAGSVTYEVHLTITAVAAEPALALTSPAGGETYIVGQTMIIGFQANEDSLSKGVDIYISPDDGITWLSLTQTSSILPGDQSWESFDWEIAESMESVSLISTACRIKVQDYDEGSGIFKVSELFSISAAPDPNAFHLKYNCGGPAVGDWNDASAFVSGGANFTFSSPFSTSGIENAAPVQIYQTCRHRVKGVETGFSYTFSNVPDGEYTVRLHFGDQSSDRAIDVIIEGTKEISDMNIYTQAGGAYKALVITELIAVSDGDGMTIALNDDRAGPADVLINGIEIIRNQTQPVIIPDNRRHDYASAGIGSIEFTHSWLRACLRAGANGYLTIINPSGTAVEVRAIKGEEPVGIPYSRLPAGMYFARVRTGNGIIQKAFFVIR